VDREQRSDDEARSSGSGHRREDDEQHGGVRGVERGVHEVVGAGVEPEELDVEHVGEPRERVPVEGVEGRPGPEEPLPREALEDHRVLRHVHVVVVVEEGVAADLRVERQRGQGQPHRGAPAHPRVAPDAGLPGIHGPGL
jgi:hypothetical protein